MKVRNGLLFAIAILMTLPLGYFLIDRIDFARHSRTAVSVVQKISKRNSTCGRKRSRHPCTKFTALLQYHVEGVRYWIDVSAGSARGHNQPTTQAEHWLNQQVQVAYDPRQPGRAYRDAFWDIWGAPAITFLLQGCLFIGGFAEPRGRKRDEWD